VIETPPVPMLVVPWLGEPTAVIVGAGQAGLFTRGSKVDEPPSYTVRDKVLAVGARVLAELYCVRFPAAS
jgi:hypothetical protein